MKEILILCKVIDNFGDIGVVYRLCRSLSELDSTLQLNVVVSDLETFRKMAGEINPSLSFQKFGEWNIFDWNNAETCKKHFEKNPPLIILQTFQCGLPDWLDDILFSEEFSSSGKIAQILNIEYLTAEKWADDFHLLKGVTRSANVKKMFFMPGFTEKTAGLIIDKNFINCKNDENYRKNRLEKILNKITFDENEFKILVFSYPKNFDFFFKTLNDFSSISGKKIHVYIAPGVGTESFKNTASNFSKLNFFVEYLPYMNQEVWDAFLCAMDFLFIRGEDSFARATLLGKPFLWNIYQQDEEYHLVKLKSFLDRLNCEKINEFSWLYNRNFEIELGTEAFNTWDCTWGKISDYKDESTAQARMKILLKEIFENFEEIKPSFEDFAKNTIGIGNLSEKLLNFLCLKK